MIVIILNLSHSSNTCKNIELLLDLFGSTYSSMQVMLVSLGLSTFIKRSKDFHRFLTFLQSINDNLFQNFSTFVAVSKNSKTMNKLRQALEYFTILRTEILDSISNNTKDEILSLITAVNSTPSSNSHNPYSICNDYKNYSHT